MQLFYGYIDNKVAYLFPNEVQHAFRVLRKKTGDHIQIMDGKGSIYHCSINQISKNQCVCNINSTVSTTKQNKLHIGIAPTKNNDRFEFFLEKATEIGINKITPLICSHSERKIIKTDRLNKILISAMKQSNQLFLPELCPLTNFSDFIDTNKSNNCFIAHCEDKEIQFNTKDLNSNVETTILIGPEGDFSKEEIALALENKYKPLTLGNSRLRTETAGIVACTLYNN